MVLLTIGVLAISLSYLVYQYRANLASRQSQRDAPAIDISAPEQEDVDGQEKTEASEAKSGEHETMKQDQNGSPPDLGSANPSHDPLGIDDKPRIPTMNPPPPIMTTSPQITNGLKPTPNMMPPPPRPVTKTAPSRTPPKPSTALRPPPSAASTLRGPNTQSFAPTTRSSSLAPSTSTLAPSARPSRKVLLEPGHSPLDWAHLIAHPPTPTFLRGADVPPSLIKVPPSLLKYHNGRKDRHGARKDAWGVYQGKVYNMTPYLDFHPGGRDQLMRGAGKEREAEKLFNEIHPWVSWENMLGECLVGILVSENEVSGAGEADMEDMD